MKLKDAIDGLLKCDKKWLKERNSRLVIDFKGETYTIPWEALESDEWMTGHDIIEHETVEAVKGLMETLEEGEFRSVEYVDSSTDNTNFDANDSDEEFH